MKEQLLNELINNTFVALRPSPVAGIGVFALRNIEKGCRAMFSKPDKNDHWVTLTRQEVESLPIHAKQLIENFCLYDKDNYFVPDHGFKKIDLSLFLNHSDTPNLTSVEEGNYFEATRDIKRGEELFLDYGEIVKDE
ncbi:MAG: SET domain-containing protein [Cyclobacteriaceae bacterium]|nr:SET domain-containing protein [Cyclobacteriaceae bacterium]